MGKLSAGLAAYMAKKKAGKLTPAPQQAKTTELPVTSAPAPTTASVGNVAVKKHIKKQHVAHGAGMKPTAPMTGAQPAPGPVMPTPGQRY